MTNVVYPDALFLFNAAVVLTLLRLTAGIAKIEFRALRLFLGSAFGGLCSVAFALLEPGGAPAILFKGLSVALTAAIAFRGPPRRLLKLFGLLSVLTFSFGGGFYMLFLLSGNRSITFYGNELYIDIPLPLFALVFAAMYLIAGAAFRIFSKGKNVSRRILRAEIGVFGRVVETQVLSDTGSTLKEPLTGKDVLVVDKSVIDIGSGEAGYAVPYRTCAGDGVLYAVRPDFVRVFEGAHMRLLPGVLVASSAGSLSPDGEYGGILPADALLKI